MSKKPKKGKTIALTDFLASEPRLVTVRESTWAAIVDEDEAQKKPLVVDMSNLPTAPRSAVDIDYTNVPENPPFVAYVSNLSFEIDDEQLGRIFADLNPKSARILRDGIRSRGAGLVEFDTRDNLIEALKRSDKEIYGRKMRVNVSDKPDSHHNDGHRNNFGNRSHHRAGGEERPELGDRWTKVERRSDDFNNDRPNSGYNRDRNHQGRSNFNSGPRDGQRSSDYGFGYPRGGGSGGGFGGRDQDRPGPRPRYNDDNHRPNDRMDRPRYPPRYSDSRDQPTSQDEAREPAKERPRLQLQPRTKPLEDPSHQTGTNVSLSNLEDSLSLNDSSVNSPSQYRRQESHDTSDAGSSIELSSVKSPSAARGAGAAIFGGAKPVDTMAREREIERKLKEMEIANNEAPGEEPHDRPSSSRPSYQRGNDRDQYRNRRPQHNDGSRGNDYHHQREHSGGRRYEDDQRRSNEGNFQRRDRERYNPPHRREYDNDRAGKPHYSGPMHSRNRDHNEHNNHRRSSDDSFNTDSPASTRPQILRRPAPTDDEAHKLALSNKFGMLNNDEEDVQSPPLDA